MQPSHLLLATLGAYLAGSIPFGLLVARATGGPDPRAIGSGRLGGTNSLRALGRRRAIVVSTGDVLKGYLPIVAVRAVDGDDLTFVERDFQRSRVNATGCLCKRRGRRKRKACRCQCCCQRRGKGGCGARHAACSGGTERTISSHAAPRIQWRTRRARRSSSGHCGARGRLGMRRKFPAVRA